MRKIFRLSLLILLSLFCNYSFGGNASPEAKAKITEAENLLDTYFGNGSNLQEAGILIAQVIESDPNYSEAYVQAAKLTLAEGSLGGGKHSEESLKECAELLDKAIQVDPKNTHAYILQSWLHLDKKEFPDALKSLEAARSADPHAFWLDIGYGDYYEAIRNFPKSREFFLKVAKRGPGKTAVRHKAYMDALTRLAWLAARRHDKAELKSLATQLAKSRLPNDAWVLGNTADLFFYAGMFDDAISYARAASVVMNYDAARRTLAKSLYGKACQQIRADQLASPYIDEAKSLGFDAFSFAGDFGRSSDEVSGLLPELSKIYNVGIDAHGKAYKQYK